MAGATAVAVDYEHHVLQRLAPVVANVHVFRAIFPLVQVYNMFVLSSF